MQLADSFFYLALLLQTGSSLAESLDLLGRMAGRKRGRLWMGVRDKVEVGESFSDALLEHPKSFPKVYVGMIQVAEAAGKLGMVLEKIADYEEQRSEVSGRLLTALAYPSVILLVGVGAVYFLLSQVLPNIAQIFASSQKQLPLLTRILLTVGDTLKDWGLLVLVPPLLVVMGLLYLYRNRLSVKTWVDRQMWRLPLVKKTTLARFSGMLGYQLDAGIPLVQAMDSSRQAVGSSFFNRIIQTAQAEVSAGQPLDKVLAKVGVFPDVYILTLSTGLRSGKLGLFMQRMSRILEKEVDNIMRRVVAMIEPLLILGVGLVVGLIVMAILGPIFDLTTLVQ